MHARVRIPPALERELVTSLSRPSGRKDLKKVPAINETIDWARTLLLLNAEQLDSQLVQDTLNVILKFQDDIDALRPELPSLLATARKSAWRGRLLQRFSALRMAEVRISPPETLDAFRTVDRMGMEDRQQLKESLALVLPRRPEEKLAFDACFDAFFRFEEFSDAPPGESDGESGEAIRRRREGAAKARAGAAMASPRARASGVPTATRLAGTPRAMARRTTTVPIPSETPVPDQCRALSPPSASSSSRIGPPSPWP